MPNPGPHLAGREVVAKKLGRDFILIELNPAYVEIAKKRLEPFMGQAKLGI